MSLRSNTVISMAGRGSSRRVGSADLAVPAHRIRPSTTICTKSRPILRPPRSACPVLSLPRMTRHAWLPLLLAAPLYTACDDGSSTGGDGADTDSTTSAGTAESDPSGDTAASGSATSSNPTSGSSTSPPTATSTSGDSGDSGDTSDTGSQGRCPNENFPPVTAHPANANYPDPFLDVYCEGDELVVESNGIPAYEFEPITPNALNAQDYTWRLPLSPTVAAETSEIPLLGTVGIAVNGLPFYGPNEGGMPDPFGDPVYNGIMDACMGHTGPVGDYHYHAMLVACLTAGAPEDEASPVLGYAFDGFPIYGPQGCLDSECSEVVTFESGWVQTGDPTTYAWDNHEYQASDAPTQLDQCNGRIGPDGTYRYHATSTFPYILGCYAGTPGDQGGDGGDDGGGDDGGAPPMCEDGQMMCCGDDLCDGPETAANCPDDCA